MENETLIETSEIDAGQTISGYKIIRKIGIGGMGVVYEAYQKSLRRTVALKMIRTPSAATESDLARFRQEAEAAARLVHPNIVEVYEIGDYEGSPYFTMRFVDGAHSLASRLAADGRFEAREAARLVRDTARAVGYAHKRGVIHRDIKPANILLDAEERPCLVDFGLAKLFERASGSGELSLKLSEAGKLLGTPHYMSPEQVQGKELTTATDIYSLGAVLYELISGAPPIRASSLNEMLVRISEETPRPPQVQGRRVPRDIQDISLQCLRKQPKNRYASADALADDLDRYLDCRPILGRRSSVSRRVTKWVCRHPGVTALSLIVTFLITMAAALVFEHRKEKREQKAAEDRILREQAIAEEKINRMEAYQHYMEATRLRDIEKPGRRWQAIDKIKESWEFAKNLSKEEQTVFFRPKLQNEAVACMALVDIRQSMNTGDQWEGDPVGAGLVCLSPDFNSFAHVIANGVVELRSRSPDLHLLKFNGPDGGHCQSLRFDRNGRFLAGVYELPDQAMKLMVWDCSSGNEVRSELVNGPDAFDFVTGESLQIAYALGVTVMIDPADSANASEFKLSDTVGWVRVDPTGRVVALARADGHDGADLYEIHSRKHMALINVNGVQCLEWNPRGRWLGIGCRNGRVSIFDSEVDEGSPFREISMKSKRRADIRQLAWHPKGVLIAGASDAGRLHLWHMIKGEWLVSWDDGEIAHPQFSSDGRLGPLIKDKKISLIEVAEGQGVIQARGHPTRIHAGGADWFSFGRLPGRMFATSGDDGVRLWNHLGYELAFLPEQMARAAVFTKKDLIITGETGISIRAITGAVNPMTAKSLKLGVPLRINPDHPCYGAAYHAGDEHTFKADDHLLAVAAGSEVLIYDLSGKEPREVHRLPAPQHTAFVAISGDGKWLASGTEDGNGVRVWERTSDGDSDKWVEFRTEKDFPVTGTTGVTFHTEDVGPSGTAGNIWFVTNGADGYHFYSVPSWEEDKTRYIEADLALRRGSICFSPRSTVFAVSHGQNMKVHRLNPFEHLIDTDFDDHQPVCFSPLGLYLITADLTTEQNTNLHLWDLRTVRLKLREMDLDFDLSEIRALPEVLQSIPTIESVELVEMDMKMSRVNGETTTFPDDE